MLKMLYAFNKGAILVIKKIIAVICLLAMLVNGLSIAARPVQASEEVGAYQVGYARVDINPYVVEDDPTSRIMALPLSRSGDVRNQLSSYGLLDDNADGVVDENDGLKATCVAISDHNGKTVLMFTVDILGGYLGSDIRSAIVEQVNATIDAGDLSDVQALSKSQIYYTGTHTHNSLSLNSYTTAGKTGTNDSGDDLSVVNDNPGIRIDRTIEDLCDAAILALKDRSAAQVSKDQLSVSSVTSPVLQDKQLNSTRHYNTDVDGVELVAGDNFNYVVKSDYADPSDYKATRGIDPKQVTQADDTMYLLRFAFEEKNKPPILVVDWRGHPSLNCTDDYGNSSRNAISSDYVSTFHNALEYGCNITFNSANSYVTG